MIENDVLLFPDTGPNFLTALRSAAFYSERVRSLTYFNYEVISSLSAIFEEIASKSAIAPPYFRRFRQYIQFARESYYELELLNDAGVWEPVYAKAPNSRALGLDELGSFWRASFESWSSALTSARATAGTSPTFSEVSKLIEDAFQETPPSLGDLIMLNQALAAIASNPKRLPIPQIDVMPPRMAHVGYLLTLSLLAERQALTPTSWDPIHLDALANAQTLVASTPPRKRNSLARKREMAGIRIAQTALERYLPRVDDLPTAELLEIRRHRSPELDAFRVGVRSLATQVDLNRPELEIELEIKDLTSRVIDPAVHQLKRAIEASRLDVIPKLSSMLVPGMGAAIGFVVSVAAGATNTFSTIASGASAIGLALIDGSIQRRKLTIENQWSLLWRLDKEAHSHKR